MHADGQRLPAPRAERDVAQRLMDAFRALGPLTALETVDEWQRGAVTLHSWSRPTRPSEFGSVCRGCPTLVRM